jgi:TolB-like protein/Flp pilus assembly protein TadD
MENPTPGVADSDVRSHLETLLNAKCFCRASGQARLMRYLVERRLAGQQDSLKEYVIGIDVFGRGESFDPRSDGVVRLEALRLRTRLEKYYAEEGLNAPLRIELPKGGYVPVFIPRTVPAPDSAPEAHPRRARRLAVAAVATTAVLIVLGAYWGLSAGRNKTASIAVLPFLNLSSEPGSEYFTEGFVEELTTSLAQVEGLQVAARSSAFQFRGKSPDIRDAGRRLGVRTVLEGSVRTEGRKMRVSAQLIDAADGFHLWSHTYEGDTKDVFAIQDQVTQSIAGVLAPAHRSQAANTRVPRDLEAYDLYLKGKYFKDRLTAPDLQASIQYLEQAVGKDPGYAPAYATLADAYASVSFRRGAPVEDALAKARAAAARALQLDETLAEAHALLAWIRCFHDWDWRGSERGLRRALELNPNSARAHDLLAQLLASQGRSAEAVAESNRALTLDPLNCRTGTNAAGIRYLAHRYDAAISQGRQVLKIDAHFFLAHAVVGASLLRQRQYAAAGSELRAALSEYHDDPETAAYLAAVQAASGQRDETLKVVAAFQNPPGQTPVPYFQLAYLYETLGQRDRAFEALEKAYEQRSSYMPFLMVDPIMDSLHADRRFAALAKRMGLE